MGSWERGTGEHHPSQGEGSWCPQSLGAVLALPVLEVYVHKTEAAWPLGNRCPNPSAGHLLGSILNTAPTNLQDTCFTPQDCTQVYKADSAQLLTTDEGRAEDRV